MRRVPWLLAAVPLLAAARLLPDTGAGLAFRLAAATLVVLLPGRLVARALGQRSGSATLVWTLAVVAGALAVTFAVGRSLALTVVLLGVAAAVALPFSFRRVEEPAPGGRSAVIGAGVVLGALLWRVEGMLRGDALFHLGRVRKLDDFGGLSLRAVDEFKDGGLHPGYAFPLWHGFLALVAKLADVDPAEVVRHEPSLLAPLALLVAFEAGLAVFRSAWLAGAVAAASAALFSLAPGRGGSYATLATPGTVARQLLVPAVLAAFVMFVRAPSWSLAATLAAGSAVLAFVHPTYALFLLIPLAGFAVARLLLARTDVSSLAGALAATAAPIALVFAWLAPIVAETASHNPSPQEKLRALNHYANQLDVYSLDRYRLAPEMFGRSGTVAVAALVLLPLAAFAARRRWAALVLGGFLPLLVIELVPWIFPRFADLVSLSQARRAAGFVPFAIALAGCTAVVARALGLFVLPVALAAGIALQHRFPGDFGRGLSVGGPALATWIAVFGGAAAVVLGIARSRFEWLGSFERGGWLPAAAVGLFLLPVAVHGFWNWSPRAEHDDYALTPGLVRALQQRVPARSVVFADLETSYRISAYLPLYVAVAPPAHVADTKANRPQARRADLLAFLRRPSRAILRRYGARWIVLRSRQPVARVKALGARVVYRDPEFVLLRL
jgi:hypothetical protein